MAGAASPCVDLDPIDLDPEDSQPMKKPQFIKDETPVKLEFELETIMTLSQQREQRQKTTPPKNAPPVEIATSKKTIKWIGTMKVLGTYRSRGLPEPDPWNKFPKPFVNPNPFFVSEARRHEIDNALPPLTSFQRLVMQ